MVPKSYSSSSSTTNPFSCPQASSNNFKPSAPHFQSSLHSVRKPSTKILIHPIAPTPPAPPRVYKVDSSNFKQLVQKLTSAPEFQPRRLKSITPPPLTSPSTSQTVDAGKQSTSTSLELLPPPVAATEVPVSMREKRKIIQPAWKQTDGLASTKASSMGFSMSPSSLNSHLWCPFPLLSPGTISSMEQGAVVIL